MRSSDETRRPGTEGAPFVQTIAARYLELRGSGLLLPAIDAERIRRWEERGVPLELALRSLERAHAAWMGSGRANRRRPFPLSLAESELETALEARRRRGLASATPGGYAPEEPPNESTAPPGDAPPSMESEDFRPLSRSIHTLLNEVHNQVSREGLAPEPGPRPPCPACGDRGFTLGAEGPFAVAKPCGCDRQCGRCEGRGFLVVERDGYDFSQPCPCQSLTQRLAAYNAAQLPARFWDKSFDNFYVNRGDPKAIHDAKAAFRDFAHGRIPRGLGLGLIGGPGRGKTHLLAATLAALTLERGVRCRYVEISFLFADLKAAISDPRARATVDRIEELAQVDVLAIDELGKGRGSVFEEEILDELIGRRYNNEKPTLFATNHPLEERPGEPFGENLLSRLGPRIFSRLHEMVVFLELPARASDHRLLLRKMMR